jgi:hypothetical protein
LIEENTQLTSSTPLEQFEKNKTLHIHNRRNEPFIESLEGNKMISSLHMSPVNINTKVIVIKKDKLEKLHNSSSKNLLSSEINSQIDLKGA